MEICANCERKIGKLETPFVWQGKVVCVECHKRLAANEPEDVVELTERDWVKPGDLDRLRREHPAPSNDPPPVAASIICPNPNCGYRGPAQVRNKTNVGISLVLLAIAFIFGFSGNPGAVAVCGLSLVAWLIYTIASHGKSLHCPKCGTFIR